MFGIKVVKSNINPYFKMKQYVIIGLLLILKPLTGQNETKQFQFDGNIVLESMTNLSGGIKTGAINAGVGELGIELYRKSNKIRISALLIRGESPSDIIGDRFGASNIDGYDSFRLYEIWVERQWANEKLNIRLGSLLADTEFSANEFGGLFLNSSFGGPAYISANTINTGPAYCVSAPGLRFRYHLNQNQYIHAGIYDGDPFDHFEGDGDITATGMHWELNKNQGVFTIGEWVSLMEKSYLRTIKAGFWKYKSLNPSSPYFEETDNRYGFYLSSEFNLKSGVNHHSIDGFLRAGWSPNANPNVFTLAIDGGLLINNPVKILANDVIGIGVVYAQVQNHIQDLDYECAIEFTLPFDLSEKVSIQPDFQWIIHPGGSSYLEDAFAGAIRISLQY